VRASVGILCMAIAAFCASNAWTSEQRVHLETKGRLIGAAEESVVSDFSNEPDPTGLYLLLSTKYIIRRRQRLELTNNSLVAAPKIRTLRVGWKYDVLGKEKKISYIVRNIGYSNFITNGAIKNSGDSAIVFNPKRMPERLFTFLPSKQSIDREFGQLRCYIWPLRFLSDVSLPPSFVSDPIGGFDSPASIPASMAHLDQHKDVCDGEYQCAKSKDHSEIGSATMMVAFAPPADRPHDQSQSQASHLAKTLFIAGALAFGIIVILISAPLIDHGSLLSLAIGLSLLVFEAWLLFKAIIL
jgi:hypothetical protein